MTNNLLSYKSDDKFTVEIVDESKVHVLKITQIKNRKTRDKENIGNWQKTEFKVIHVE